MTCETCGGEMYDNRQKVATGWKGPLWKCKNKDCAAVIWPPKGQKVSPGASQAPPRGPKWTWHTLAKTYEQALLIAELRVLESAERTKIKATLENILQAAAVIAIEAFKSGVEPPKAKLPPKPEPKPVPDDEPEPWEERQ